MKNYYKGLLTLLLCLLFTSWGAHGQSMRSADLGRGDIYDDGMPPIGANPYEDMDGEGQEMPDTTKQRKARKPLESWFFGNEVKERQHFAWNVDMFTNNVNVINLDTLLNEFNIEFPFLREEIGDAFQGNLGGATVPLGYHLRPDYNVFSFTEPYYSYIYHPENAPFYNVKTPFTQLGYITAGQRSQVEENISILHAQNATPSTGFNVTYHTRGTRGIYVNQRTRNTQFSTAFSHTGKRYSAHAGYIFNTLDMRDNGGVVNDFHIRDTIYEQSRTIPVWLNADGNNAYGARILMRNNTFYSTHTYGIPLRRLTEDDFSMRDTPAIFLGYAFQYDRWSKRYTDLRTFAGYDFVGTSPAPEAHLPTEEYYRNWFINDTSTRDSIFESRLSNRLFIQLQPWDRDGVIGTIDAGVGVDRHYYYMFMPEDYLTGNLDGEAMTSYYVYGAVEGKIRKYIDWGGKLNFVPLGYRQGDMDAEANARLNVFLRGQPVSLSGKLSYRLSSPSYWDENHYSNHYEWSNSFDKENETRLDVKLEVPQIRAEAGFHQSVLANNIYYRARGVTGYDARDIFPVQSSDVVSITGMYVRKEFRFGGFHLDNRVLLQWSTNQREVPVPFFGAYLSWFYEFDVVRNVLRMRAGLDARYNSRYYAYGFNPAIGQFYTQQVRELGEYPMVDAFVTAKWKTVRIFLKFEHVSENLFDTRDFFSILHYPHNQRVFKIGVSWSFNN